MSAASVKAQRTSAEVRKRAVEHEARLTPITWTVVAGPPGMAGQQVTTLESPESLRRLRIERSTDGTA